MRVFGQHTERVKPERCHAAIMSDERLSEQYADNSLLNEESSTKIVIGREPDRIGSKME